MEDKVNWLNVPSDWKIPEAFRKRLGEQAGRQKAMVADGHLLLILHAPPGANDIHRVGRVYWRSPRGEWVSDQVGSGVTAMNRHLDEYMKLIRALEGRLATATVAQDYFGVLNEAAPMRRSAHHMLEALQAARDKLPEAQDILNYRDRSYEVHRGTELIYEDAKNGLDYSIAKRTEEEAESSAAMATASHRLNLLAAFFFPLMTLAAIFGMEIQNGLEWIRGPWLFLAILAVGFISGFFLHTKIKRKPKRQERKKNE